MSVDTIFYMDFIRQAGEKGLLEALREYSGFARPVYLALLYLVSRVGIDPLVLMDIAHPALALVGKRIDPARITAIITLTPTIITGSAIAH